MIKYLRVSMLVVLGWFVGAGMALGENISVKGSATMLPIVAQAIESYVKINPDVRITLSGGGSGAGIKALIEKSANIANLSRPIKNEEIILAKSKGVTPVETIIAIDAVVPIVHPENKVQNLSVEQLSRIYQGKIRNWKEVGGDDLQIVVISLDSSSTTFEEWAEIILPNVKMTAKAQLHDSSGGIVQAVSRNRNAIGFIGMGYLYKSLKALSSIKDLSVNGIQASAKTVLAKEYPIIRSLYMYTDGQPSGETAKFIKFVLSPAGRNMIDKAGFVPLAAPRKNEK